MDGSSDKGGPVRRDPKHPDTARPPKSDDTAYLAWVNRKINQGQQDLGDPTKRHGEREVWREHGLED